MFIKETCLYSRDLPACVGLYAGTLGLTLIGYVSGRHAFFRLGGSVLLCFNPDSSTRGEVLPAHGAEGSVHVAFEVTQEELGRLEGALSRKGVEIIARHQWAEGVRCLYFRDPGGNLVELIESGFWEQMAPMIWPPETGDMA